MNPSFSKPVMIALVAALIGLVVVFNVYKIDTRPDTKLQTATPPKHDRIPENSVETDETPEFDVQISTRLEGPRNVLEFTVTEIHGWAVQRVLVMAKHRSQDPDTGEWEVDSKLSVRILLHDIIEFGRTSVQSTTLVQPELDAINGDIGIDENWVGHVYEYRKVFKPK